MVRLFCQKFPSIAFRVGASSLSRGNLYSTSSHKPLSVVNNTTDKQSLTLSYLQKSCGLSLESAISASEKLRIDATDKPDSVLNLLRTLGLTQTDVKNLITKRPSLLVADLEKTLKPNIELFQSFGFTGPSLAKIFGRNPRVLEGNPNALVEFFRVNGFNDKQIATIILKRPNVYMQNLDKVLKPKLDFFKSLGVSESEILKMLAAEPLILERSLEKQIIPCVQFLKGFLGTDENVLKAIKASYRLLEVNLENVLEENISTMLNHGVPESLIVKMLLLQPKPLILRTYRFSEVIGEIKKLGFEPTNMMFVLAVRSMAVMSKVLWEKKLEAYMSFGLTKGDIYSAFKKQPMCMLVSEKKIKKLMGFFVNKLNMEPSFFVKSPSLLLLSLEKRIAPRCSVLQLLMSKELIKGEVRLVNTLRMNEKQFLEKFVKKYQHKLPQVVKAYQGDIEFLRFPFDLKM